MFRNSTHIPCYRRHCHDQSRFYSSAATNREGLCRYKCSFHVDADEINAPAHRIATYLRDCQFAYLQGKMYTLDSKHVPATCWLGLKRRPTPSC